MSDDDIELTNTAELYDPATGEWSFTGSLNVRRVGHTATLLPNGKVLFAGGGARGQDREFATNTAELYDPATGTVELNRQPQHGTAIFHAATLLQDGKVLVAGGCCRTAAMSYTRPAPKYTTQTLRPGAVTGSLNTPRAISHLTTLPNGNVLMAGGEGNAFPFGSTPPSSTIRPLGCGAAPVTSPTRAALKQSRCCRAVRSWLREGIAFSTRSVQQCGVVRPGYRHMERNCQP